MLPYLEERGVLALAAPYPERPDGLVRLIRKAREFDLVWLQKKMPGRLDHLLLKRLPVPLVFDYDDAISFRAKARRGSYHSATRRRRFNRVVNLARAVTCGNGYLASLLEERKAHLVYPSPVPLDVPRRDYARAAGLPRLGWIGGRGNLDSLRRILPALQALARKHPFVLRIVSDGELRVDGLEVEQVPWAQETQEQRLAEMDAGLMPLDPASPFDRGKCGYKILQYMAGGVVAVAEQVGMNAEVIRDGVNGRLVNEGRWEPALAELLATPRAEWASMAGRGRATVEAGFGYPLQAGRLADFFGSLLERGGS